MPLPRNNREVNLQLAKRQSINQKDLDKIVDNAEKSLREAYRESLRRVNRRLEKLYSKIGTEITLEQAQRGRKLQDLQRQIKIELNKLHVTTSKEIQEAIRDNYKFAYNLNSYAVESTIGLNLGFTQLPLKAISVAAVNPLDAIKWGVSHRNNIEQLTNTIRREINAGLIQGRGFSVTAREINKRINIGFRRARTIVRTETKKSQSLAEIDNGKELNRLLADADAPFRETDYWNATLDGGTRDLHRELDGQPRGEDGYFRIAGIQAIGPGLSGIAEFDINCRCYIDQRIEGFTPQFRRDNVSRQITQYTTYNGWANKRGFSELPTN